MDGKPETTENNLKGKISLDLGRVRYHISHSREVGVAEGRKNLVDSATYRVICPERAFFRAYIDNLNGGRLARLGDGNAAPLALNAVMPGLVPGIHVGRPARLSPLAPRCRKTWMPGTSPGMTEEMPRTSRSSYLYKPHFFLDSGRVLGYICQSREVEAPEMPAPLSILRHSPPSRSSCPDLFHCCPVKISRQAPRPRERPSPPLNCHPGLDPGSREAGRERCLWPWTPDQVRGDSGGERTAGAGGPRSVSRSGGRAGNPAVPMPCTRSAEVKPDSNGTSPGMTEERKKRRGSRARPCGGQDHACDRHRYRPGRHPPRARSAFPGGSMPTEMSTGRPGRQMSTFPPGICGTRMPTR